MGLRPAPASLRDARPDRADRLRAREIDMTSARPPASILTVFADGEAIRMRAPRVTISRPEGQPVIAAEPPFGTPSRQGSTMRRLLLAT